MSKSSFRSNAFYNSAWERNESYPHHWHQKNPKTKAEKFRTTNEVFQSWDTWPLQSDCWNKVQRRGELYSKRPFLKWNVEYSQGVVEFLNSGDSSFPTIMKMLNSISSSMQFLPEENWLDLVGLVDKHQARFLRSIQLHRHHWKEKLHYITEKKLNYFSIDEI